MTLFDPIFLVFGYKMVLNSADQPPRSREIVARRSLTVVALKLASLNRAVFQFFRKIQKMAPKSAIFGPFQLIF